MIVWIVEQIDCDGGMRGRTWDSYATTNRVMALVKVDEWIKRKDWPDREWKPGCDWLHETCQFPDNYVIWSNNKGSILIVLHPMEVHE